MREYLLYCLDGYKLDRCERFTAADDRAAIEEALRLRGDEAAELWCGSRKVKVFQRELIAQ